LVPKGINPPLHRLFIRTTLHEHMTCQPL